MKFPTQFTKHERVFSNPGSKIDNSYQLVVNDDGTKDLKVTGKINVYEKIQSYKDSTDLNVMIQKYINGDANALNRKVGGQFIDATKMPHNLVEVYQLAIDSENYFNSLPIEIRREFGFDVGRFMAASDAELVNVFNKFTPQEETVAEVAEVVAESVAEQKGDVE